MEVSQDVYAWLVTTGIVDSSKTIKIIRGENVLLDEKTTEIFKNAQFDKLVIKLEDLYNKFYRTKMNYSNKLHDIKDGGSTSNVIRFTNWKVMASILCSFGLEVDDDMVGSMTAGRLDIISKVVTKMFTLCGELIKRTNLDIKDDPIMKKNVPSHNSDVIELNHINEKKELNTAESLLEYFLISLCQPFNIRIRQAAGLLANNRKFLIQVANKGIKGDYTRVLNWYTQLNFTTRHLVYLVKASKAEAKTMTYATISCGIYSKDNQVAVAAMSLVNNILIDLGPDYEWFFNEGINGYIYCATTHPELVVTALNSMETYAKNRISEVVPQIIRKYNVDKEELFNLFECLVDKIKKCNIAIYNEFKKHILEFLLKEQRDKCKSLSMLLDMWLILYPDVEDKSINEIFEFLRSCLDDSSQHNTQMTAIVHSFRVMSFLGKKKDDNAPKILKLLVTQFIKNYEDISFKELCLSNFFNIFKNDQNMPIDIFVRPYLKQLKSTTKYDLSDFSFLDKIIALPRFSEEMLVEVFEFYFSVVIKNKVYYKIANAKFNELIDKGLLFEDHYDLCSRFVRSCVNGFVENPQTAFYLLDAAYDIVNLNNQQINKKIEKEIAEANRLYRINKGEYSNGLLSLLWYYDSHDDIILQLEEKFAKRYDPIIRTVTEMQVEAKVHNPKAYIKEIKMKREAARKENEMKLIKEMERKHKIEDDLQLKLHERALELGKETIIKPKNLKLESEKMTSLINNSHVFKSCSIVLRSENPLIKPEGTLIDAFKDLDFKEDLTKFNIECEEDREKKAVETLLKENSKKAKYFFHSYINEKNNQINKQNILKMFRDLGLSENLITLDELTKLIRIQYGSPLTIFDESQFMNLIVLMSNITFSKLNKTNSISTNLSALFDLMHIPKTTESNKLNQEIKEFLNKKRTTLNPETELILPPGFKNQKNIKLSFDYTANKPFIHKFLPENKIIALEIVDELIHKAIGNHILEPFVKIAKISEVVTTENIPKWSKSIFKNHTNIVNKNPEVEPYINDVSELVNDMLKFADIGRKDLSKAKQPSNFEKEYYEEMHNFVAQQNDKEKKRKLRNQFLKENLIKMKEELKIFKEKEKVFKDQEKKKRDETLRKQLFQEKEERHKIKEELNRRRLEKKETEVQKIKEERVKEERRSLQQKKNDKLFLKAQKKKLKKQFIKIQEQKTAFSQMKYEEQNPQFKQVDITKTFEKRSEMYEFEKVLNAEMNKKMKDKDISEVLKIYENHINHIYQIYTLIDGNKIVNVFHNEGVIHAQSFFEFCSDFLLTNLLVNTEQIRYIFSKITMNNEGNVEDKKFLDLEEFNLSLLYLTMYTKFIPKGKVEVNKSSFEKLNAKALKDFIGLLGFKLPYFRRELEEYFNDRKLLSEKERMKFKNEFKKNGLPMYIEYKPIPKIKRNASHNSHSKSKSKLLNTSNISNTIKTNSKLSENKSESAKDKSKVSEIKNLKNKETNNKKPIINNNNNTDKIKKDDKSSEKSKSVLKNNDKVSNKDNKDIANDKNKVDKLADSKNKDLKDTKNNKDVKDSKLNDKNKEKDKAKKDETKEKIKKDDNKDKISEKSKVKVDNKDNKVNKDNDPKKDKNKNEKDIKLDGKSTNNEAIKNPSGKVENWKVEK